MNEIRARIQVGPDHTISGVARPDDEAADPAEAVPRRRLAGS